MRGATASRAARRAVAAGGKAGRGLLCLLAVGLALVSSACGESGPELGSAQPQGSKLRITLGTQGFPEAGILGELWRQSLAAEGYAVDLRKNVGPAKPLDEALVAGRIDGHVAYTGTVLSVVAGEEVTGLDAKETYRRAQAFYAGRGQTLSAMTVFENVDAIATTKTYAQENQLSEVGDLRSVRRFTLAARPEFESLQLGLEGLQRVYGLTNARFKPVALGAQYTALDEGDADAVNVFTTDPQLADGDYEVLEDPERLFGSQQAALVVDSEKLERVGDKRFLEIIADTNRRLSRDVILELNQAVASGQDEVEVATRFLRQAGIIGGADGEEN